MGRVKKIHKLARRGGPACCIRGAKHFTEADSCVTCRRCLRAMAIAARIRQPWNLHPEAEDVT